MSFVKKLRLWLLSGIGVILPLGVTIFILIKLFQFLDGIFAQAVILLFGRDIPGIGLLAILLLVIAAGMLTSNLFGKRIFGWFQRLFLKIPVVKTIYDPVHRITAAISDEKTKSFQKVVLIEFPTKGTHSIGFITNDRLSVNGEDKISVFIPTTPNPTNGFLVIMDEKDVAELNMTVNEALNAVVSVGSAMREDLITVKPI